MTRRTFLGGLSAAGLRGVTAPGVVNVLGFGQLLPRRAEAATVLHVGPGGRYALPSQANAAAKPGDEIHIQYNGGAQYHDTWIVTKPNLTFKGVGGRPVIGCGGIGGGPTPAGPGQGLILQHAPNLTIDNLEIFGVDTESAGGIRMSSGCPGGLTVRNCYIHHCDHGIVGVIGATGDILVEDTEIAYCGFVSQTGNSHIVYLTTSGTVTIQRCYFHHCHSGMLLKSKSRVTIVRYNRIHDEDGRASDQASGPIGQGAGDLYWNASQNIDIAWGGIALIYGNSLQKVNPSETGSLIGYDTNSQQALDPRTMMDPVSGGPLPSPPFPKPWAVPAGSLVQAQGWFPKLLYVGNNTMVNEDTTKTNRFVWAVLGPEAKFQTWTVENLLRNNVFVGREVVRPLFPGYDGGGNFWFTQTGARYDVNALFNDPRPLGFVDAKAPNGLPAGYPARDYRPLPRAPFLDRAAPTPRFHGYDVTPIFEITQPPGIPAPSAKYPAQPGPLGGTPRISVSDAGAFEKTKAPSSALKLFSASPGSLQRGQAATVTIVGRNIAAGATVSFGNDVTAGAPAITPGEVTVPVQVSGKAAFGGRTITVTNPDRTSATLPGGFLVAPPPLSVTQLTPTHDRVGRGNQTTPSGVPDTRLRLTGLLAVPTAIHVVAGGGIWHRPYNNANWIIDYVDLGGGSAEIFFEPFGSPPSYTVMVTYPDGTTATGVSPPRR